MRIYQQKLSVILPIRRLLLISPFLILCHCILLFRHQSLCPWSFCSFPCFCNYVMLYACIWRFGTKNYTLMREKMQRLFSFHFVLILICGSGLLHLMYFEGSFIYLNILWCFIVLCNWIPTFHYLFICWWALRLFTFTRYHV